MSAQQLPGMPLPWPLAVTRTGDGRAVAVHAGPMLLSAFGAGDLEMRDLTICALTEGSRFQGKTVAAAFGIQPSQVSRIRSRYREHGARGLVHQMGRPPILSPARLRQARTWAGQGLTHAEIGRKLGVSRSRISELIKQHGVLLTPGTLPGDADDTGADPPAPPAAKANRTPAAATAPEPTARAAGEAAMTRPAPRATGTAGAGRWRRGSSPGRLPAVTRARCWCTPSPAGSAPRAC
jgi:transcriptional regulator with XRE-family HTH domain